MQYQTKGKFLIVTIHKALGVQPDYDFVRVRKDYFTKARSMNKRVLIRTPRGERVINPDTIKEFKTVKEVFLFPDNPMILYEITVPVCPKKPDEYYEFG